VKRIWTPWRMKYILSPKGEECIFCAKAASDRDEENYVLYRGKRAYIMLNLYPYTNGHLMVIPYQHVATLELLDEETLAETMLLIAKGIRILRRAMKPHGFNVGCNIGRVAGAGVDDHVHLHVVPRWEGDTNFMPVLAETRLIPELLTDTYRKLKRILEEEEG